MVLGLVVGILCAVGKASRSRLLRGVIHGYIEAIRNTPFLVQLLLIYLGLPSFGLRLTPGEAALLAMVINLGAYATSLASIIGFTELTRAAQRSTLRRSARSSSMRWWPHSIFRCAGRCRRSAGVSSAVWTRSRHARSR